jgi:hypothetical protein
MPVGKVAKDIANAQIGSAVVDALKVHAGKSTKGIKSLSQTKAFMKNKKGYKFPSKGKKGPMSFNYGKFPLDGKKMMGRYSYNRKGNAPKGLIGLNKSHKRKFKQHITGKIVRSGESYGHIRFPLKKYQLAEFKYYPHTIHQSILLMGTQEVLLPDNNLAERVDYEKWPSCNDKDLISCIYYPLTGPANFSGICSFTRMQSDANSEGFSKVSVLGRQNRADEQEKYINSVAGAEAASVTSISQFKANPNSILTSVLCKLVAQSDRNFSTKIVIQLVRCSNPEDVVSNQGITNDELTEFTNSMSHIDYDAGEIIFQQSKILPPCKDKKFVHKSFNLKWTGSYKTTQSFKDETAVTVKTGQGGTFKYGQGALPKISGSYLSQSNLSNRLVVIIKAKRLGDTQIGMATQSRDVVQGGVTRNFGIEQPYNLPDDDNYMSHVANGASGVTPIDQQDSINGTSAGFRCKAQLELTYRVKDAIRNIPVYINSSANNGKTKILHASTYDSNFGTLNATLNVTD